MSQLLTATPTTGTGTSSTTTSEKTVDRVSGQSRLSDMKRPVAASAVESTLNYATVNQETATASVVEQLGKNNQIRQLRMLKRFEGIVPT